MLHNTLSALLVSVASRYAELSPADVGIGIGGGRLVIDNVQLRADTFNGPNTPFHVHEGRAGRLRVNVPWSALSSAPVEVYLENVHLIAAPKHTPAPANPPEKHSSKQGPHIAAANAQWHQTIVGRLLFNVSVEVYGLKVEYRDDNCVGIVSIASLRATSAGSDWKTRFVSLVSDLDPEQPDASAVSMRKLVRLSGVHWVMIPRAKDAPPAADGLLAEGHNRSPRFSERYLDLNSYESKSPILDGIAITVRVLLCTGNAFVADTLSPGLHAEIDVDLEEPAVSLTAQQMKWIDHIIKHGLGLARKAESPDNTSSHPQPATPTKRRLRSQPPLESEYLNGGSHVESLDPREEGSVAQEKDSAVNGTDDVGRSSVQGDATPSLPTSQPDATGPASPERDFAGHLRRTGQGLHENVAENSDDDDDDYDDDYDDDDGLDQKESYSRTAKRRGGGLSSFWEAIVGENGDETVDDAAIALGLVDDYSSSTEEGEPRSSGHAEHEADTQYARNAVNAAASAGGLTLQVRLKTPDLAAWDEVEQLREELEEEREERRRLQDVEEILVQAEQQVEESYEKVQQLRDRNAALVKELEDLEWMTSQAARNKDAMIRQTEAALTKAERNLQALHQAHVLPRQPEREDTTQLYESEQTIQMEPVQELTTNNEPSAVEQTNANHGEEDPTLMSKESEGAREQPSMAAGLAEDVEEGKEEQPHSQHDEVPKRLSQPPEDYPSADSSAHLSVVDMSESEEMFFEARDDRKEIPQEAAGPTAAEAAAVMPENLGDMGSKLNVKHIEEAMSSEGLTLV